MARTYGEPLLVARVPLPHILALKLEARRDRMTLSAKVRVVVRDHLESVYNNKNSGVIHLDALTRLSKEYITRARLSRQATKVPMKAQKDPQLPGAEKRDELEVIVWKAIQEAVDYSKTEQGAKDAEARLLALRVTNGLMRTELAILKHKDPIGGPQMVPPAERW